MAREQRKKAHGRSHQRRLSVFVDMLEKPDLHHANKALEGLQAHRDAAETAARADHEQRTQPRRKQGHA